LQTAALATSPFMSLILFDMKPAFRPGQTLAWPGLKVHAELWLYRIGGYLLINVMDDPAWLALMFC